MADMIIKAWPFKIEARWAMGMIVPMESFATEAAANARLAELLPIAPCKVVVSRGHINA